MHPPPALQRAPVPVAEQTSANKNSTGQPEIKRLWWMQYHLFQEPGDGWFLDPFKKNPTKKRVGEVFPPEDWTSLPIEINLCDSHPSLHVVA